MYHIACDKTCEGCLLHNKPDEHSMAFCYALQMYIYTKSVACPRYDDVEPF